MSVNQRAALAAIVVGLLLVQSRLEAAPQDSQQARPTSQNTEADLVKELAKLPVAGSRERPASDYLIDPTPYTAELARSEDGRNLILSNGLVRRVWRLAPNGACVAFDNLMTDQAMLRSVRPEARLTIDGDQVDVGGLVGQPNHAFLLPEWLEKMKADPKAMQLVGFDVGEPAERIAWGRVRHAAPGAAWPPKGAYLRMDLSLIHI